MKKIVLAISSWLFVPFMAFGAISGSTLTNQLAGIKSFINVLIPFIIGLAVLVFIFGLFKYITAGGDEEKLKSARGTIIWGIIIIAVMISVWGLVNFVVNAFGLNESGPSGKLPQIP